MPYSESKEYLDLRAVVILFVLTLLWGFTYIAIKYSNEGLSPVFSSALRSIIASLCGVIYCLRSGERLFHKDIMLFHGLIVSLLFSLQFACLYLGMLYTEAGRSAIFVYVNPFVVALGAHFLLKGDKLTLSKAIGLILAFAGLFIVYEGRPKSAGSVMILGDMLEIMAGFFWGATTLYIKKFMAEKIHPLNTFLYQVLFSIPILLAISFILEPRWIYRIDAYIIGSMIYQSLVIAFISYIIWFKLIHKYAVSRLSAFTFFTPIFGALFGIILLGEEFTVSLMMGLPLVSLGIFMVNWRRRHLL